MWRKAVSIALVGVTGAAIMPLVSAAQLSNAAKIRQAMAAGPASITRNATIKDLPGKDGKMAVLREGSNGWVCLPSNPPTKYKKNDAMCLDPQWQEWFAAVVENREPKISQVGYSYMLTADEWGSNTDPVGAKGPTPDNQWHYQGPHIMMVFPDSKMLAGVPVRPSKMGPYVMMAGTPHAHVMFPVR